jgi:diketogulonate reductase-like aldo/keto reductase
MLVHWSHPDCEVMRETWRAMEQVYTLGWARSVGVSNYCPSTLQCILETAKVVPAVNQVKYHAGLEGADPGGVKSFCDAHGIALQAYSPLGGGGKDHSMELIDGDLVSEIGGRAGRSGAQVSLRWVIQHGVPLSTKSSSENHLRDALEVFNFRLPEGDMERLDKFVRTPVETYSFSCDCDYAKTCSKLEDVPNPYW